MYEAPAVGTILPAQPNTTVPNPGPVHDPYGLTEWSQAQAQATAYQFNLDSAQQYKNYFRDSWLVNYEAGKIGSDATPPSPPCAFIVLCAAAEAGGIDFRVERSGQAPHEGNPYSTGPCIPVCAIPEYTKIPPPQR